MILRILELLVECWPEEVRTSSRRERGNNQQLHKTWNTSSSNKSHKIFCLSSVYRSESMYDKNESGQINWTRPPFLSPFLILFCIRVHALVSLLLFLLYFTFIHSEHCNFIVILQIRRSVHHLYGNFVQHFKMWPNFWKDVVPDNLFWLSILRVPYLFLRKL